MQRIRVTSLTPGQVFEQGLFTLGGQKLVNAGVPLTTSQVEAIRRRSESELLMATSTDELARDGVLQRADGSRLKVGQRVEQGLITNSGQMLLEPGETVESHHLDALAAGGQVFEAPGSVDQRRQRLLIGDSLLEDLDRESKTIDRRIALPAHCDWIKPQPPGNWPNLKDLAAYRHQQVEMLRVFYARIEAGVQVPPYSFDNMLDSLLQKLASHPTQFTQLALLCPRREDYLPDHAYTVTVLAMAVASRLNWTQSQVRQVGLVGLLFDLGMLLVPQRVRTGANVLGEVDRSRVQRHPVFTLAMMQAVEPVDTIIKLAAVQHHERENGSGYPRGSRRDSICDLARVLAVTDSFAAATEPRQYRSPKLPYTAMEETLRAASMMQLWKPGVRALVQAAGLFPVGSYVRLSDNRNAHVIVANPVQLDKPVLQPLDTEGRPKGDPIDLATLKPGELSVVRPLATATG